MYFYDFYLKLHVLVFPFMYFHSSAVHLSTTPSMAHRPRFLSPDPRDERDDSLKTCRAKVHITGKYSTKTPSPTPTLSRQGSSPPPSPFPKVNNKPRFQ